MTENTKKLRVQIDSEIQSAEILLNATGAGLQNIYNCYNNLRLAKGWLGKALHYLGSENPYPPADTPDQIPETVDTHQGATGPDNELLRNPSDQTMLHYINRMRDRIQAHISAVEALPITIPAAPGAHKKITRCNDYTWKHLQDASMHLGFQLQFMSERHKAVARHEDLPDRPKDFDDEYYEKAATRLSGKK